MNNSIRDFSVNYHQHSGSPDSLNMKCASSSAFTAHKNFVNVLVKCSDALTLTPIKNTGSIQNYQLNESIDSANLKSNEQDQRLLPQQIQTHEDKPLQTPDITTIVDDASVGAGSEIQLIKFKDFLNGKTPVKNKSLVSDTMPNTSARSDCSSDKKDLPDSQFVNTGSNISIKST